MYIHTFEKLEVWQLSRKLAVDIYKLCSGFPKEEMFGLSSQLKRAVISIASNIAEGTSRTSGKDKAHFSTVAFASLMEVLNQLIIANDLGFLDAEKLTELRVSINEISNKLNALRKSQMSS
ncbi:four helix bundle protein [Salmonirosea aquatica]|uniref:Four helix bundle protein n=1 Tax=Salmonirosea aquatica TaxID=2654236 RepID=A0A7C9BEP5_9BACT|nr:four helix bundle protein [Cytophagaceae bacterium SJW1-29]